MEMVSVLGSVAGRLDGVARTAPSKGRIPRGGNPNIHNPARPYSRPWSRASATATHGKTKAVPKPPQPTVDPWATKPVYKKTRPTRAVRLPPGMPGGLLANQLDGHIAEIRKKKARSSAQSRHSKAPTLPPAQPFDPFDGLAKPPPRPPTEMDGKTSAVYKASVLPPNVGQPLPPVPSKSRAKKTPAAKKIMSIPLDSSPYGLASPPKPPTTKGWGSPPPQ